MHSHTRCLGVHLSKLMPRSSFVQANAFIYIYIYIYIKVLSFFVSRNESVCDLTKSKGECFTEFPAESLIDQERVRISVT
jgi:hypothetical protein